MSEYLQVGIITRTHGIKGEVKVFPTTDDNKRFNKLKEIYLDLGNEKKLLEIDSVKYFKQFVILKFKGYDNPNDIEKYKTKALLVTRENAVKLNKDEYFLADLIGLKVITEDNTEIGQVVEVLQSPANDVYVIKTLAGKELLIPAIKQCILEVNLEEQYIKIRIMEGMMDE